MADGRYGKLKVFKDNAWHQPKEIKVYKNGQWVTFGNNLDENNTNNIQVYTANKTLKSILQRKYYRTTNSGVPYVYTDGNSALRHPWNNTDDGFQVIDGFKFECDIMKTSYGEVPIYQAISPYNYNSGWVGYILGTTNWWFNVTWMADGRIRVNLRWANTSTKRTGYYELYNTRALAMNEWYHLNIWCTNVNASMMKINLMVGYGNDSTSLNTSKVMEWHMRNRLAPNGGIRFKNNLTYVANRTGDSGGNAQATIDMNNANGTVDYRYQNLYRKQDSVTTGYWA